MNLRFGRGNRARVRGRAGLDSPRSRELPMMDTDLPDPQDTYWRLTAGKAGGRDAVSGDAGKPDNWLADLLNGGVAEPDKECPHPTEPGTAPEADRAGGRAAEVDPPYIGRYQVIRPLGQGAFGRVYLAHDADLHRRVAIKVPMNRDAGALVDLELYLNEAR